MRIALVARCPNGCGELRSLKDIPRGTFGSDDGRRLRCSRCGATVYTEEAEFVDGNPDVASE